ncbi:glycoside hydrolase family 28 protein [Thermophagus xiamenensis]|uniref:Polygalacturonase n=1 Tax=Thermophagus xiamenensis TaxID=385682 RepID=A0A1I1VX65_9BACT|nr:glycoside hydrolase family 28 protein [Thermophagus xiamenensis]SFD87445.1 Polygalacturonase [Thermophagus xiamenensis]
MKIRDVFGRICLITGVTFFIVTANLGCKEELRNSFKEAEDFIYHGLEFDMPRVKEPVFSDLMVSIVDFGAVGDGVTDNSEAFAKAIDYVSEKGGGRVIVPRGIWLTGPIIMKSNIDLHVQQGAVVRFSPDFEDYPLIETIFEGLNTFRCMSPIHAHNLENIAFTGKGIFDGNGDAWRPVKKSKLTESQWKKLVNSGGVLSDDGQIWYPSEKSKAGDSRDNFNVPDLERKEDFEKIKDFLRPVMVSIKECKRVLLDGPTFQNSPAWNIHPLLCEDVTIRNLTVRNPWYSQNGDGLDLESCKNVVIYNNSFDVGDDAICFKSGKDEDGRKRAVPTENVVVKNNVVYHGHGGFVIGSEMSGGVRNVHVSNCTFIGTDVGLRFKSTRGRGGVVENIYISNIDMIDIPTEPIRFNLFYGGKSPVLDDGGNSVPDIQENEPAPVTEETPAFRNIFMKNIRANGFGNAAFFMGLPEMNLQNVHLENALLRAAKGISIIDADGIMFKNVNVTVEKGPALIMFNGKNINVEDFRFKTQQEKSIYILGAQTQKVNFSHSGDEDIRALIRFGSRVDQSEVRIQ